MFTAKHYVPILKGKEGEFSALKVTSGVSRGMMTPVVEFTDFAPPRLTEDQLKKRKKALWILRSKFTSVSVQSLPPEGNL